MIDVIKEFADLKGHTLAQCFKTGDEGELHFILADGRQFKLYHEQDCCEGVSIESIVGDLSDLIGEPLLMAEEVESLPLTESQLAEQARAEEWGTSTWTFYKLATRKGYVDVRWFGSSNGYYNESVSFSAVS